MKKASLETRECLETSGVTGGAWGSEDRLHSTMTASACALHTDTQLAPSLEQGKTQDYQTTSINRINLLW